MYTATLIGYGVLRSESREELDLESEQHRWEDWNVSKTTNIKIYV